VSDFSYFVTFIDDYSRMTWLFLMKDRYEILSIFQRFHREISTQFNCSLKILRSDNALEYEQHALQGYCVSHSIIHQTSCPRTPEHNSVVERKIVIYLTLLEP